MTSPEIAVDKELWRAQEGEICGEHAQESILHDSDKTGENDVVLDPMYRDPQIPLGLIDDVEYVCQTSETDFYFRTKPFCFKVCVSLREGRTTPCLMQSNSIAPVRSS